MVPCQVWTKFLLKMSMKMHWREIWTSVKTSKIGELNALAYKDLILSINTSSSIEKVVFGLVKNAKNEDFY